MAEHLFIQPPDMTELDPTDPLVFLGGPIQGAPKWQYDARDIIHGINTGIVVASPRKEYVDGEFDYYPQVDWEWYRLRRAGLRKGAVMFYLPEQVEEMKKDKDRAFGRAYGQTTRTEFGMWLIHKVYNPDVALAVGMPGGFGNENYWKRMIELEGVDVPVIENVPNVLEETCRVIAYLALEKANRQ